MEKKCQMESQRSSLKGTLSKDNICMVCKRIKFTRTQLKGLIN